MPSWHQKSHRPAAAAQPVIPVQQPTFSPPLAMQQSVWDSIVNGSFIDAKIFVFSRRSHESGRVNTPKALFVNTHVLATACGYFRSLFDFSDGIVTGLKDGLPPDVEPVFDMVEHDPDLDYDCSFGSSVGWVPTNTQPPIDVAAPMLSERTVKGYVVKYTAYRTLRAIIWYIYSGEIFFSPNCSPESPGASAKSIYRFADEHGMDGLKSLAFKEIAASVDRLTPSEVVEEMFSVFTSRYPELHTLYIKVLQSILSSTFGHTDAFQRQLSRYFSGELPHSRDILTSLLQSLMDRSTISNPHKLSGDCNTIRRVSRPWPARTKKALRRSLDEGIFEDFSVMVPPGSVSVKHLMHFAGVVDEVVSSSISHLCRSEPTSQHDAETSLSSWQAIAYYMYTDCISFGPLGLQTLEPAPVHSPSDAQFRGYLCSPREVLYLACQFTACDALIGLATTEIVSYMTPENVVDEMFSGPPPPAKVIERGAEIIRANRYNRHLCSRLQKVLEEAASGESSVSFPAFSACFGGLFK